jgi:hypothetical protein
MGISQQVDDIDGKASNGSKVPAKWDQLIGGLFIIIYPITLWWTNIAMENDYL